MDKTLHKKLTAKHLNEYTPTLAGIHSDDVQPANATWFKTGLAHEMNILKEVAKDLLQPRPEAISRLLQMAKDI